MGSSLVLTGGAATARTLKESISLASHGFTVGDVLRWNNGSPSYVRAQADSAVNAEVLGIVSAKVDINTFELTYGGYIDLPQFAGISYPVLFLSGVCAGGLTHNPPSALGTVVKPVVTRHPTLNGFVLNNYLGTQIGGSSTIGIDEIQPVGTIMPFAGSTIPDTWLACDGSAYSISTYTELYSKLCYSTGDRVPMYGHIAELTLSAIPAGTVVGDYVVLPTDGNNFPSTITATGEEDTLNPLILAEGQIQSIDTVNKKITVLTTWKYNKTKKYFEYPNAAFKPATNYTIINPAGWVSGNVRGTINATVVTAVSITHFLTPDLSSRFIVGSQGTGFAGQPENATFSYGAIAEDNSRGTTYAQGAFGGEEKHILTAGEMPSHKHDYSATDAYNWIANTPISEYNKLMRRTKSGESATMIGPDAAGAGEQVDVLSSATLVIGNTGGGDSHNNMPPYLAVRYIIKAKPYTRAAIIDGVDLPYSNLLIRSTDSNSLRSELLSGASGGDLVFYTNSGEASKTGTERMRLTAGGNFGIGTNTPSQKLHVYNGAIRAEIFSDNLSAIFGGPSSNLQIKHTSGNTHLTMYNSSGGGFIFSTLGVGGDNEKIRITGDGNLGIGTSTPGASLDVNGTIKTNTSITVGSATLTAPSGTAPLFGARAWAKFDSYALTTVSGESRCSLLASGNISKIVRVGLGRFDVYFSTPMPDANYSIVTTASKNIGNADTNVCFYIDDSTTPTVNSFRIFCTAVNYNTSVMQDVFQGSIAVFR